MTTNLFANQPTTIGQLAVTLRPYQQAAVDSLYQWFENNSGNPLIVVPTGGGKSLIIAAFIHSVHAQWPKERILVLTHVRELIEQNHAQMLRAWPSAPAGIYSAGIGRREHDAPVLFAGIQSVYEKAAKVGWTDLVIVDEAHLIPAKGMGMYRTFLDALRSMNPHLKVIGLTATPFRTDTGSLADGDDRMFHGVAYDCDLLQLIADGYLSPVTSKGTKAPIDTSSVAVRMGEFAERELEAAAMAGDVVPRAVAEIVSRGQDRKAWLLFCCGIDHANLVLEQLRAHGISSAAVFGETKKHARDQIVVDFKAGKLRAIVNVGVLTTGFDAPQTDLVVLLRPTMSPGLYCLDSETEVLTSHGWRGMGQIAVGDCALAMDMDTQRGRWASVRGVVQRSMGDGEKWVSYEAPHANFRVTDQHRMLFRTSHDEAWRVGSAATMACHKGGVYMPTAVRIDQPGVPLSDAEIYLIGMLMTDGTVTPFQATIYQSERYPAVMSRIEAALDGAGISYRKNRQSSSGGFSERHARWRYSISAGDPREGKPGKGVRYLFPWLDKDFSPALFSMSRRQFMVLLDAMWDGDGTKKAHVDYTPRSKQLCTSRKFVADRMQAIGVMHGFTVHMRWEHSGRKKPIAILTFTDREWRSVGGNGHRPQIEVTDGTSEQVWCIETDAGTIVTRRNGKVTVMGNCQMVGRALRLAPGKRDALVLDFGGNVLRHGPIDQVKIKQPGKKEEAGIVPARECPQCQELVGIMFRQCPACGFEWVILDGEVGSKHDDKPAEAPILGTPKGSPIERWAVNFTRYQRHDKPGKTSSLRVDYECGFQQRVSEWVCFEHPAGSFPRKKAEQWWIARGGALPVPETVDLAMVRQECGALREVATVTVDTRGDYPELRGVRLSEVEAGAVDFSEAVKDSGEADYGDLPF